MTKTYDNPNSFKKALDARLKARAKQTKQDFTRLRQMLIFERFLERVYGVHPKAIQLKGGMLMELRLRQTEHAQARMTKDIDVRVTGDFDEMMTSLRQQCAQQGEDFMRFVLAEASTITALEQNPNVYDGYTFNVKCTIANKLYGNAFKVDIAVADGFVGPPETIEGDRFLDFCGIEPVTHHVYPVEMHLAEKLHALSLPRTGGRENSRLKDLIDVGLLIQTHNVDMKRLKLSVTVTFEHRGTHLLPDTLPPAPQSWYPRYEKIADTMSWESLDQLHTICSAFFNNINASGLK